jgi:pimeloyl-ACP methyl ester carboxylesterase
MDEDFINAFRGCVDQARVDDEMRSALRGAPCNIVFELRTELGAERIRMDVHDGLGDLVFAADIADWQKIAQPVPPVGWHSFTAAARQPGFELNGKAVEIAQTLHALERLFEILRGQIQEEPQERLDLSSIVGQYITVDASPEAGEFTVFQERSGTPGKPLLLMLHTAGADSRQFHALMGDEEFRRDWSLHAFDMPGHGRSPEMPEAWQNYVLTKREYLRIIRGVITSLRGVEHAPLVLMGCSMGAAIALHAAREYPELIDGVVALEAPFRSAGRRTNLLSHAQVNQAAHNASYVRGLMSPSSPLSARRHAAWIYSSGAFEVYSGDLAFYSDEYDAQLDVAGLDGRLRPVLLTTGAYDYSATPADTRRVAELIPGALFYEMPDMGHFPMIENPGRFLAHVRPLFKQLRRKLDA